MGLGGGHFCGAIHCSVIHRCTYSDCLFVICNLNHFVGIAFPRNIRLNQHIYDNISIMKLLSTPIELFLKDFIYLFLERGDGKEKERERNLNVWLLLM